MSSLRELLEGKTLPVKVRHSCYSSTGYFEVIAKSENDAIGFFNNGNGNVYALYGEGFELYTEPKKTHTRWLWANQYGMLSNGLYTDEQAAVKNYKTKLLWSATEFEE